MPDSQANPKHDLIIVPELKDHLNRLSSEEFQKLELSCIENGIMDALKVWMTTVDDGIGYILFDGFHRHEIALIHDIPFEVTVMAFDDIEDVKKWMTDNQAGRRNISNFRKIELDSAILALKEVKSKYGGTFSKVYYVMNNAEPDILSEARSGSISINEAYQRTRKKEQPQDYNDKELLINQVPAPYKSLDGMKMLIFAYFQTEKEKGDIANVKLAEQFQTLMNISPDELSTDTIVKKYVRMRDDVRKFKPQILANES